MLRHIAREAVEKRRSEIGCRMMRAVRAFIAAEEQSPVARFDRGTGLANERNAGVGELLAFLANLLALVVGEGGQKIGEIAITAVAPVKLNAVARDQTGAFALGSLLVIEKQNVQRRKTARVHLRQRGIEERSPCYPI